MFVYTCARDTPHTTDDNNGRGAPHIRSNVIITRVRTVVCAHIHNTISTFSFPFLKCTHRDSDIAARQKGGEGENTLYTTSAH